MKNRLCRLITMILLFAAVAVLSAAAPVELYVAPGGSDAAPGTKDQPLATLERARDLAREMKKSPAAAQAPARIILRDGIHFLRQPLALETEDSGTVFTALPGERPVISGGQAITKWQSGTINGKVCWVAELGPNYRAIRELFVEGQADPRRPQTRVPEKDFFRFSKENPHGPGVDWRGQPASLKFNPGDLKAWENISDVELVFLQRWVDCHNKLSRVDEAAHTVHFSPKATKGINDSNNIPARYFVLNVKEALDAPGEWYLDRPAGKLYYMPLSGETMEKTTAIAPRLLSLIQIKGTPSAKVQDLRFEHVSFRHAECNVLDGQRQGAVAVPGAVVLENAQGCAFFGCEFTELGSYGAEVTTGSLDNRFVACRFENLGGGGVRINSETEHTTVADCTIRKGGLIWHSSHGVFIMDSPRNRVLHNHIHDYYYSAVGCGWTWGYAPTHCYDNLFEGNLIHDLGFGILDDMGGFYTLGTQAGTVIRGNVIHDVTSYKYGGWGLYTDEGSSGILLEGNLVYRANNGGFHQHYGRDNIVRNNVFAMAANGELRRSRYEHINSFYFEKNIVYLDPKSLLLERYWDDGNYVMGGNLFWRDGGGKVEFTSRTLSLSQWQAEGKDRGSVLADPLFKNAAADDFTLQPGSPALKMGFMPIDAAQAGPRKLDTRQVALEQWPLPQEKPRVILEGRLVAPAFAPKDRWEKGYGRPLVLTAAKPVEVTFTLLNRGTLPAKGEVEFKIVPAGAATIQGPKVLKYELQPAGQATCRLLVKTSRKENPPACRIVTVPHGEGLVPSALCINSPDKPVAPKK